MVSIRKSDNILVRLWLVLLLAAVASLADVAQYAASHQNPAFALPGLLCAAVFKASALTLLYSLCRRSVWLRVFAIAVIAVFIILSLLNGLCWLFYGFGISMKLLKIIVETNPGEVREFLPELVGPALAMVRSFAFWISVILFVAAWLVLPKIAGWWFLATASLLSVCGAAYLLFVFCTAPFGRTAHLVIARSGRCVAKYISDSRNIRRLQAMKRPLPYVETLSSSHAAERVVVVIGESASRAHLSLYGYPLPTTPRLDSIRGDLFLFDDAVASSTTTAENMPRLLTFMTDEPGAADWYEYPSVLQVFRRLGYRTYWISNQEYSGRWSNLSSILSEDADVLKYVGSMDSDDHFLDRFDDVLIPEWKSALSAPDSLQLVFLHLMGSHFQYENRFPPSRRRFIGSDVQSRLPRKWLDSKKATVVADYDNSILFSDSILAGVIADVRAMRDPALFIYLSDHGEDVYDDRDYRGREPKFVDVPFIVFANEAYRQRNPGIVKAMEEAANRPFSTSELPQILLGLTGTAYHFYDSVRDPLSPGFAPRPRWVDDAPYH